MSTNTPLPSSIHSNEGPATTRPPHAQVQLRPYTSVTRLYAQGGVRVQRGLVEYGPFVTTFAALSVARCQVNTALPCGRPVFEALAPSAILCGGQAQIRLPKLKGLPSSAGGLNNGYNPQFWWSTLSTGNQTRSVPLCAAILPHLGTDLLPRPRAPYNDTRAVSRDGKSQGGKRAKPRQCSAQNHLSILGHMPHQQNG